MTDPEERSWSGAVLFRSCGALPPPPSAIPSPPPPREAPWSAAASFAAARSPRSSSFLAAGSWPRGTVCAEAAAGCEDGAVVGRSCARIAASAAEVADGGAEREEAAGFPEDAGLTNSERKRSSSGAEATPKIAALGGFSAAAARRRISSSRLSCGDFPEGGAADEGGLENAAGAWDAGGREDGPGFWESAESGAGCEDVPPEASDAVGVGGRTAREDGAGVWDAGAPTNAFCGGARLLSASALDARSAAVRPEREHAAGACDPTGCDPPSCDPPGGWLNGG
ncbi:hypothetical protein T484DRAFT_1965866 [Baffinella frigidus]|nr:hypothetical protein T484DRAFT_1965866 [Cryptophyta sp. CCMP2293]